MTDNDSPSTTQPCKYFIHGMCRFGESCFFSHEPPISKHPQVRQICRYFLAGKCSFGQHCFYDHTTPTNSPPILQAINHKAQKTNSYSDSYSAASSPSSSSTISNTNHLMTYKDLCPYYEKDLTCPYGDECEFLHGNVCDICNMACLRPDDTDQNERHKVECMQGMEADMEEAFAVQRSSEKNCGICMEVIWDKENEADSRFGILENCNHVFCLSCIRRWRASKSYEKKIVKACPECRVKSDFVTPNKFWFEDQESKKKIINDYKLKLGKTPCKYFNQGEGQCPFGSRCFYLHQNKDGTLVELPEPQKRYRPDYNNEYSSVVTVYFDFSEDEDDDFDVLEFFRSNVQWENDTSDSDVSDLFELSGDLQI